MDRSVLFARPDLLRGGAIDARDSGRAPLRRGVDPRFWLLPRSRRRMLRSTAGAALALGAGLRMPSVLAQSDGAAPQPVPGGIDLGGGQTIHVYDYSQGQEPSTITDFRGIVGIHHLQGTGTVTTGGGGGGGIGTPTPAGEQLHFDTDMRFMQGTYRGEDGKEHEGTFGFV